MLIQKQSGRARPVAVLVLGMCLAPAQAGPLDFTWFPDLSFGNNLWTNRFNWIADFGNTPQGSNPHDGGIPHSGLFSSNGTASISACGPGGPNSAAVALCEPFVLVNQQVPILASVVSGLPIEINSGGQLWATQLAQLNGGLRLTGGTMVSSNVADIYGNSSFMSGILGSGGVTRLYGNTTVDTGGAEFSMRGRTYSVENYGAFDMRPGSVVNLYFGMSFVNKAGGTFSARSDGAAATIGAVGVESGRVGIVNEAGASFKFQGSNATSGYASMALPYFTNAGIFSVANTRLDVTGKFDNAAGSSFTATNAYVSLLGGGTHAGTLHLNGYGQLTLDGNHSFLDLSGIDGSGSVLLNGGTFSAAQAATATIGAQSFVQHGGDLTGPGTWVITNASVFRQGTMSASGGLGSTILEGDAEFNPQSISGPSAGAGYSILGRTVESHGYTLLGDSGNGNLSGSSMPLMMGPGSVFRNGMAKPPANAVPAVFEIRGRDLLAIAGTGPAAAFVNRSVLRISDYWLPDPLAVNPPTLKSSNVTMGVDLANRGTVDIAAGNRLTVTGAVAQHTGSTLSGGKWVLNDNATLDLRYNPTPITHSAADIELHGPQSTFVQLAADPDNPRPNGYFLSGLQKNSGRLALVTGQDVNLLPYQQGATLGTQGNFENSGKVDIDSNSQLLVGFGGGTYNQTAGTTHVDGYLSASLVHIGAGVIKGGGVVAGRLTVDGTGLNDIGNSPGRMVVSGDYTQGPGGTLRIQIDGPDQGSSYDWLLVGGTAYLGGQLDLVFGYVPASGQSFDFITASAISGTFASVLVEGLASDRTFALSIGANGVSASVAGVAAVPEPENWALMLAGLALMGYVARRRHWQ